MHESKRVFLLLSAFFKIYLFTSDYLCCLRQNSIEVFFKKCMENGQLQKKRQIQIP